MVQNMDVSSATDVLLTLLYAPGNSNKYREPIKGITRLEKLMFLLSRETSLKEIITRNYAFDAYDYGPFSNEILDDIEALKSSNILKEISYSGEKLEYIDLQESEMNVYEDISSIPSFKRYELTEKGEVIGKFLFDSLSDSQRNELIKIKKIYNSLPIKELLSYVYNTYPEVTKKSVIKDKILKYHY